MTVCCYCDAYEFPHRANSGKCRRTEQERVTRDGRDLRREAWLDELTPAQRSRWESEQIARCGRT